MPKKTNFHDYISAQIKKGTKIEMEHTSDPKVAQTIALQHLRENKDYYKYSSGKGKEYLIKTRHPSCSKSSTRSSKRHKRDGRFGKVY